jgi:hypothetical protein
MSGSPVSKSLTASWPNSGSAPRPRHRGCSGRTCGDESRRLSMGWTTGGFGIWTEPGFQDSEPALSCRENFQRDVRRVRRGGPEARIRRLTSPSLPSGGAVAPGGRSVTPLRSCASRGIFSGVGEKFHRIRGKLAPPAVQAGYAISVGIGARFQISFMFLSRNGHEDSLPFGRRVG